MRTPNETIPVGDRTLPPEWTKAPLTGRQALIARYGDRAQLIYEELAERGRLAYERGAYEWALHLLEQAAVWRRLLDDQEIGEQLVLAEEAA